MAYLGNFLSAMASTVFFVFLIAALGYLVGSVTVRGISFGSAGVLLVALAFGLIASYVPYVTVGGRHIVLYLSAPAELADGTTLGATGGLFSLISSIGTSRFVTAGGRIAGPECLRRLSRKSLCYILMGVVIIAIGTAVSVAVLRLSRDPNLDASLVVGLMAGALTSTPGFSAAMEVAPDAMKVTAGYGIGYLFGVLGVVLFVQFIPKLLKVDMTRERESFVAANAIQVSFTDRPLRRLDPYSFFPFSLTVVLGFLIGAIEIPGVNFSFGASGGVLIAGLIIGPVGRIGAVGGRVPGETLKCFRERGLCLFLIGAGVPGGVNFIANVRLSYFIYGAVITLVPMIAGYFMGKYVFHMSLFNNLGSISGGMTSTPALGALIVTSGTEDVTSAYAATYPFALFCVVLAARIIVLVL